MSRKSLILWSIGFVLLMVCCTLSSAVAVWVYGALRQELLQSGGPATVTATPVPFIDREPVDPPATPPLPEPETEPAAGSAPDQPVDEPSDAAAPNSSGAGQARPLDELSTEQKLTQASLPERDQRLLAIRLKNEGQDIPQTIPDAKTDYQVGDTKTFWVTDNQSTPPGQFQSEATLRYVTDHSYWWVEDGSPLNEANLQRSAERFESQTYPTNREFFGSEWSPGIDNDVRVHIFMGNVPGVAGYFAAANSYARQAEPYSNEHEMFFINLNAISPGNGNFDGVLAHEFQHMIHWYQDRNEDTWVNEGMSELATFINGYGPSTFRGAFVRVPDTQLNSWADSPGASLANYGGSFMFMAYFLERFGEQMMRAVVAHPQNGIPGFNAVLAENGYDARFDDIFADFLVANFLHAPDLTDGRWGYTSLDSAAASLTHRYSSYPVDQLATVYQFGADYIELTGDGDLSLEFTGSTRVKVIDNEAHSGRYQWYSHRGDDTNTRLTRTVDLRDVESATLNYWVWYDIESDWDYGYVEVSTDGGQTWTILETPHSATDNPSGNAYGPGYTGLSGGDDVPDWIEESLDLTPYAGQEIQLRFEYVTDDAVNRPGWAIDDISIPEIGFFDDAEQVDSGWQAEGFVRIDNVLAQRFLVQLIEIGDDEDITVRSLPLDDTNQGAVTLTGLGDSLERAVLVVSGLTPITTEPAGYQYQITRQ